MLRDSFGGALVSVESRKCGKDGVGCETRDLGGSVAVNNKESGDEAGLQIWSMRFVVQGWDGYEIMMSERSSAMFGNKVAYIG
jgi:hypothetical protein